MVESAKHYQGAAGESWANFGFWPTLKMLKYGGNEVILHCIHFSGEVFKIWKSWYLGQAQTFKEKKLRVHLKHLLRATFKI